MEHMKKINANLFFTPLELKSKYYNMLTTYKRIKKRHAFSEAARTVWSYFKSFDEVYGRKHSIAPPKNILISTLENIQNQKKTTTDTDCINDDNDAFEMDDNEIEEIPRTTFKRGSITKTDEILNYFEKQSEEDKKMHEEYMQIEQRKLEVELQKLEVLKEILQIFRQLDALKKVLGTYYICDIFTKIKCISDLLFCCLYEFKMYVFF